MISISSHNPEGDTAILVDADVPSSPEIRTARILRTPTLSGGAVMMHMGVRDADRTIKITARVSQTEAAQLLYLFENETIVHVSTKDGFYEAAIQNFQDDWGLINLTILIKESV